MAEKWQKIGSVTADVMAMNIWYSVIVQNCAMAVSRFRYEWQQFVLGAVFYCQISFERRVPNMAQNQKKLRSPLSPRLQRWFQGAASTCYMMVLFAQPAAAVSGDTIWSRFSSIMADIYGELVGISTIVAVTAASVALLVRMISRNERAVSEATSWLKRIIVTWIVLNTLGFAVAYLQPLIQGGQYTPT